MCFSDHVREFCCPTTCSPVAQEIHPHLVATSTNCKFALDLPGVLWHVPVGAYVWHKSALWVDQQCSHVAQPLTRRQVAPTWARVPIRSQIGITWVTGSDGSSSEAKRCNTDESTTTMLTYLRNHSTVMSR